VRTGVPLPETLAEELAAQAGDDEFAATAAAVWRCRGLLEDGAAEEHFARALRLHERVGEEFGAARTALCYGERLRRAGRRVDAREQLRRALAAFERAGAEPWVRRATAELRAAGETRGPAARDAAEALTPQELQIALVVGGGATNREAAAALFLSAKTIEMHLSRIYRKLGIRSRAELAARVARHEVEPVAAR
jgi:DNA-binding CsgD family transcriptional regulator